MSQTHPDPASVRSVLRAVTAGEQPARDQLSSAVRGLLAMLAAAAPGRSVEVRVPPFGAIQCVEGPRHTRGTPPNVVQTDGVTWVRLATGELAWAQAVSAGLVTASGARSDLSDHLPLQLG